MLRGDINDVTHKPPAEKQHPGGQVGALRCQEGRGGRGHPAALCGCLEAEAVPGVQTPISYPLLLGVLLPPSQPGEKLCCRCRSWWGCTWSLPPWGWEPILPPCFHCTMTPVSLGPSPGAKTSQICCHPSSCAQRGWQCRLWALATASSLTQGKRPAQPGMSFLAMQVHTFTALTAWIIPHVPMDSMIQDLCVLGTTVLLSGCCLHSGSFVGRG